MGMGIEAPRPPVDYRIPHAVRLQGPPLDSIKAEVMVSVPSEVAHFIPRTQSTLLLTGVNRQRSDIPTPCETRTGKSQRDWRHRNSEISRQKEEKTKAEALNGPLAKRCFQLRTTARGL